MEEKKSKINIIEGMFMILLALAADGLEALLTAGAAIPIIGMALPVLGWLIGISASAILVFWFIMKGVSVRWLLWGSGIDLIPLVSTLPARTAGVAAAIIEDRMPAKAKAALGAVTGKPTQALKGVKPTK